MKRLFIIISVLFLAVVIFGIVIFLRSQKKEYTLIFNTPHTMHLISSAFVDNKTIPSRYTCDGNNINPPLQWTDVPEGTKSFVLIMEDPDVPRLVRPDGMWDHWIVWNIPSETRTIAENSVLAGVVGKNTGGKTAYGGPCPPDKEHRYFFKLFALDAELSLPAGSSKSEVEQAMEGHILDSAELIGRYNRT